MRQWQYLQVGFKADARFSSGGLLWDVDNVRIMLPGKEETQRIPKSQLLGVVNQLGAEGWEMVSFLAEAPGFYVAWFKRPCTAGQDGD